MSFNPDWESRIPNQRPSGRGLGVHWFPFSKLKMELLMNTQNSANSTQSHALDWDAIQIAQWKFLVSRIDEPAIAALILEQMGANPELAKRSTGLVLRAKTVVIDAQTRAKQPQVQAEQTRATLQASNAYKIGNVLAQTFLAARYILLSLTTVLVFLGELLHRTVVQFADAKRTKATVATPVAPVKQEPAVPVYEGMKFPELYPEHTVH